MWMRQRGMCKRRLTRRAANCLRICRRNPSWRKVNPAESPILILTLTSETASQPQMYDVADSILAQKISQIAGIGQVFVGGSSRPAVRAEVNPLLLSKLGVGLDEVRTALGAANSHSPKGQLADAKHDDILNDNDQLFSASQYAPLILAYHNGAPVRLSDVATVVDSSEDIRNAGTVNGQPTVLIILFRQPDANIIETVDRVRAMMPLLQASIPPAIHIGVAVDRTTTIRASVHDVEISLAISVVLVILVVFVFLRSVWATAIPSVAVPLSLVGTFGVMYLLGFTIDNLSLMALTISTGFVVDDAIVVIENITRYLEQGFSAGGSSAAGFGGDRLYGAVDEHIAGRGVHSHSADGRDCGPFVPGIRDHVERCGGDFDGGFTDDHAHHVRQALADGKAAEAQPALSTRVNGHLNGCTRVMRAACAGCCGTSRWFWESRSGRFASRFISTLPFRKAFFPSRTPAA